MAELPVHENGLSSALRHRVCQAFREDNPTVQEKNGKRLLEPAELRTLVEKAGHPLKAMILFGINAAFWNIDCALLEFGHLDLEAGWIDYMRSKTGTDRRCPIWPETTQAIRDALSVRPAPAKEFAKLVAACGLKRPGLNFGALRHTFQTIGDETAYETAVKHIMGHTPLATDMSAVYRERISDELRSIVNKPRRTCVFCLSGERPQAPRWGRT